MIIAARVRLALMGAAASALLAGCVSAPVVATVTPSPPASPSASASAAPSPSASSAECNAEASYAPQTTSSYVDNVIKKRGYLLVGVSADTRLLGAVDPAAPAQFQGFDIDMARLVAKAALGDETKIRFKVITTADRIAQLNTDVNSNDNAKGGVDLVARAFTMTCDRWKQVAFSERYFVAHQGILVPSGSDVKDVAGLAGKRVCAPKGSTSLDRIAKLNAQATVVGVANHTDCLVLLQQGEVDAITGDNTILAGFRAQDPTTTVLPKVKLSDEPYGLGVPLKPGNDFAAYVNSVLEQARTDGSWQKAYDVWLKPALGAGTQPIPDPNTYRSLP